MPKKSALVIIVFLCSTYQSAAQDFLALRDTLLMRDFTFINNSDAWLTGRNAAALTCFQSPNISLGSLSETFGKGGWINYYQSDKTHETNARIVSFHRLSTRCMVYGEMSYRNLSGYHMTGSAFIDPTRRPFDIVEDSLTNPGKKHLDTYHLVGALGIDLWKGWSVGAKVNYTTANYAKYKDLRHKNKLMDLQATASFYIPVAQWISAGVTYDYHRNTESLRFSTYGKNDKTFMSLISYGAFIGQIEQFGNSGFTDSNNEQPLFTESNGWGLQFQWNITPILTFHNDFSVASLHGYYGRKSPYTIVYTHHKGHLYTYSSRLQLHLKQHIHQLNLCWEIENIANYAEQYRQESNGNNVFHYQYYNALKTANKVWATTNMGYTGYWNIRKLLPTWNLRVNVRTFYRKQTSYYYPYYRRQQFISIEENISGERNILLSKGILTLNLGFAFIKGTGQPYEDGTFVKPSDKQSPPASMDTWLYQEHGYLTAPQYKLGGGIKYAFRFPGTDMKTFIETNALYHKTNVANNARPSHSHTTLRMTLGCEF